MNTVTTTKKQNWLIVLVILCLLTFALPVHADNKDVKDNANVLDNTTQSYIKQINDDKMSKIKGHPQIAVYTVDDLNGDDLDNYAQKIFDKYKFGTKGYDNGVLLLIDVGDHKIRMQTGYGIESAVPDEFVNQLMDSTVKSDFRKDDYSSGTKVMVDRLAKRIETHQNDLRSKSAVNTHQATVLKQQQEDIQTTKEVNEILFSFCMIIVLIGSLSIMSFYGFKYLRKRKIEKLLLKEYVSVANSVNEALIKQGLIKNSIDNHLLEETIEDLTADITDNLHRCKSNRQISNYIRENYSKQLHGWANLFALTNILNSQNCDWLEGNYDSPEAVALLNLPEMQKPLTDYQSLAAKIIVYSNESNLVLKMINQLTSTDYKQFKKESRKYIIDHLNLWPDLSITDINDAYTVGNELRTVDKDLIDYKNSLINMFNSVTVFETNFDKCLNEQQLSATEMFDNLRSAYFDQYVSSLRDDLDDLNDTKHVEIIDTKFTQRALKTDLVDHLNSNEAKMIDKIAPSDKEKALKARNDAIFIAIASAAVATLVASQASYVEDHRDEYDDDDYDNWFGSGSSWSGGNDDWFDGGSFGGDGGFSGGGGGDAGW